MGLPTYVNMLHHVAEITTCLFEVRTSLTALLQCLMLPLLYPFPTSISASQLRVWQSYAITRSTLVFLTVVKIRLCITVQLDNYVFFVTLLCNKEFKSAGAEMSMCITWLLKGSLHEDGCEIPCQLFIWTCFHACQN